MMHWVGQGCRPSANPYRNPNLDLTLLAGIDVLITGGQVVATNSNSVLVSLVTNTTSGKL